MALGAVASCIICIVLDACRHIDVSRNKTLCTSGMDRLVVALFDWTPKLMCLQENHPTTLEHVIGAVLDVHRLATEKKRKLSKTPFGVAKRLKGILSCLSVLGSNLYCIDFVDMCKNRLYVQIL